MSDRDDRVFVPWHRIVQVANQSAFFEIIDSNPPFLKDYELPQGEDYKKDKFLIVITQFKSGAGNSKQMRHYIDKKELLLLVDQMSRGVTGIDTGQNNEEGKPVFKPILESFKGSPDREYPEWDYTSRILRATYTHLRLGPCYQFEMVHSEGKKFGKGAIVPTGNKTGVQRVAFPLPILAGKNPPAALHIAHQTKLYLNARETDKFSLWRDSLRRLRGAAKKDEKYNEELEDFLETYGKHEKKKDSSSDERIED